MPRSLNIAEFNTSDGLPDNVSRKLNYNFSRVSQLVGGEAFASQYDPAVVELKIQKAIEALRQSLTEVINQMEQRLTDAINDVESDVTVLEARVSSLETTVSSINTKLTAVENALATLGDPVTIGHGGTGKANRTDALKALGINWGTGDPASTGTANSFYIKVL